MPLLLGLAALLVLSVGGAWFLSSPPEAWEPAASHLTAQEPIPPVISEPTPQNTERQVLLAQMAQFLDEEQKREEQLESALAGALPLTTAERDAIRHLRPNPRTLRSDLAFLLRMERADGSSAPILEQVQTRIDQDAQACFDSLRAAWPGFPPDAIRLRAKTLDLLVDLSRRVGREREIESMLQHELVGQGPDHARLQSALSELQTDRSPAALKSEENRE